MGKKSAIKTLRLTYYVETFKGIHGTSIVAMPLDSSHYQAYHKEYHEKFTPEKCIAFLTKLFEPSWNKKSIGNHFNEDEAYHLRACLMDVIAITYSGEHSVQLIYYKNGKQTVIPTFYTSLNMAVEDLKPWVDYFYQINTKYVVNHWHVSNKPLNRREIHVNGKIHRVNKKFITNIDLIKKIKEQLISAHCGIQGISAEHDRPERGTGNIP